MFGSRVAPQTLRLLRLPPPPPPMRCRHRRRRRRCCRRAATATDALCCRHRRPRADALPLTTRCPRCPRIASVARAAARSAVAAARSAVAAAAAVADLRRPVSYLLTGTPPRTYLPDHQNYRTYSHRLPYLEIRRRGLTQTQIRYRKWSDLNLSDLNLT